MIEPLVPFDEARRLCTLHSLNILDTPFEERFDRITRIAAALFKVPFALVSLIDSNRQWFKSCYGLDMRESPRNISFCGHAILSDSCLVIPDTLEDERFWDNPLVNGDPFIRFYAGQPLQGLDGTKMGTLCIIDQKPRRFSPGEQELLRDLAALAQNELNHTARTSALEAHISLQGQVEEALRTNNGQLALRVARSNQELYETILQLEDEVQERQRAQEAQHQAQEELECRVKERTAQLAAANAILEAEVSERRQAEEQLRESELRFRQLAENTKDAIWMTDVASQNLLYMSPAYERIWGRSCQSLYEHPKSYLDAIHPEDRPGVIANQYKKLSGDYRQEFRVVRPDGTVSWVCSRSFPIRNEHGEVYRLAGITEDITERKQIERMKNEFISTVSHELRTPLTSIRGSLGLLLNGIAGELPAVARNMITIGYNNSERLVRLINDILDMDKIEKGHLEFFMKPLDLVALVRQALEDNRGYAEEYKVKIRFETDLPAGMVNADEDRLLQVMTHLLSNAVKFSTPDSVVTAKVTGNETALRVSVIDHGCGIPPEFHSRIFQKFVQADSSDSRQKGGTGLGLSITRALIEKQGGQIAFTSSSEGTTFYFDLPRLELQADKRATLSQPESENSQQPCILICEDDPDIAGLLEMVLAEGGFASETAYSAAQVKELLATNPQKYRAMTLDLVLPGQDGFSLLRELRSNDTTRGLPVVIVSARSNSEINELNGNAFGILDWIGKPIDQERLLEAVAHS
ncbi:MAG TPA: ATP-binding protein [Chloroflexia bacterium]|nr:ATP-binding protein [Chloroflexia bacterium]